MTCTARLAGGSEASQKAVRIIQSRLGMASIGGSLGRSENDGARFGE